MGDIVIVDTTVFLNLLRVPQFDDHRDEVYSRFQEFLGARATLLLPLATVLETGGHIADVTDGRRRRHCAEVFCDEVRNALQGNAPWVLVSPPSNAQLDAWLNAFPNCAMREISLSDVSLIELWRSKCEKRFATRVLIWSLDDDLKTYDRKL